MNCVICEIAKRTVPSRIVHQDENTIVFLPRELNVRGHMVVSPVVHYETIFDIDSDILSTVMKQAQRMAENCKRTLDADGVNILHASGRGAQQSIMHFHLHIIPRHKGDNIDAWPNLPEWEGDLDQLLLQLRDTTNDK